MDKEVRVQLTEASEGEDQGRAGQSWMRFGVESGRRTRAAAPGHEVHETSVPRI